MLDFHSADLKVFLLRTSAGNSIMLLKGWCTFWPFQLHDLASAFQNQFGKLAKQVELPLVKSSCGKILSRIKLNSNSRKL